MNDALIVLLHAFPTTSEPQKISDAFYLFKRPLAPTCVPHPSYKIPIYTCPENVVLRVIVITSILHDSDINILLILLAVHSSILIIFRVHTAQNDGRIM